MATYIVKKKIVKKAVKKSVTTVTFGDVAENHVNMQKIGKLHEHGYTVQQLHDIAEKLTGMGIKTNVINLTEKWDCTDNDDEAEDASVLVIRKAVQFILGTKTTRPLILEHKELDVDKKALMRGKVVNKHARWNLCFDDEDQEPDYENGKGRIVSYKHIPLTQKIRETISIWTDDDELLKGEANYYYDLEKCGIGYHGDSERKKVVGMRFGNSEEMPLYYQWFQHTKPVG